MSSVEYVRTDVYYDLHVPGQEHYLAHGLWHHNTGKTRSGLEKINYLCETHPLSRHLIARKTRTAMSQTVLVEFETSVLWPGHPAITGTASRAHRESYVYPNGSEIVVGGFDKPEKYMSGQYDTIWFFEATDFELKDWEQALTRLRNGKMPYQQIVGDCNPSSRTHWLNERFPAGVKDGRRRILSRHSDNGRWRADPAGFRAYMAALDTLTGPRRARLRDGLWVTAEGLVYSEWNPAIHMVAETPPLQWYFASVDWGNRAPGVLQVWGVDAEDRMYRVLEIYQTGKMIDWWAEQAVTLHGQYKFQAIVCDHDVDNIEMFNQRLGTPGGRSMQPIAIPANKARETGMDQVRWALSTANGGPRLFFKRDALLRVDETLKARALPKCSEEEISDYVFLKPRSSATKEAELVKREDADPECADHGMDAMRYAAMWKWRRKGPNPPVKNPLPEGSIMGMLGVDWDRNTGRLRA